MKKIILDFCRRGLYSCGFGPIVLAILYAILKYTGVIDVLTVSEVCIGIISLWALAFLAGGLNAIYQIERLPLMTAVLIHGAVLYVGYLITYLVNGWLDFGMVPILVFSGIFIIGYFVIWIIIYSIIRKNTDKVNQILQDRRKIETFPSQIQDEQN